MDSRTYFAALPRELVASELMKKCDNWYNHIMASGHYTRMKRSYNAYYGLGEVGTTSEITRSGVQGELALIKVNHFRNLVQHMLVMTTQTRPAMEARALNSDFKTEAQVVLANGILDYYMRDKDLESYLKIAVEMALVLGEGYLGLEWDADAGGEYDVDPETNQMVYTGDLKYRIYNSIDIVKDLYQENPRERDWLIIRDWRNKFSLAAKYPDLSEDILDLTTKDKIEMGFNWFSKATANSDLVPVYTFYHRRTEALPEGRMVTFMDDDVVVYDGPLPYADIPVYRISPSDFIGTVHGYSTAFDLLAIQEAYDALCSAVITNQSTFGVQNIMIPTGHNVQVQSLVGGLNLIEYDPGSGPPSALNLTNTPAEIFRFIDKLEQVMETISGVNSVARGNPEASLRSGNALALVQSMAIQFNSGLQQSYSKLIEDIGTATITCLKEFATAPRIALITGKNNRSYVKEFVGADLGKIDRVIVDVANPLAKTTAGRMEIADNLVQQGLIKTPQEYFTVLKTGDLNPLLHGDFSEIMLIHDENEKLAAGEQVQAVAVEDHMLHIREHKSVLSSVDAKKDATVVQAVLDHINSHLELLRSTDPQLLMVLGQQPLQGQPQGPAGPQGPMPQPGQPASGAGPQAQPPATPAQGGAAPAEVMNTENPAGQQLPGQPNVPTNPLSGQPWDPSTGGAAPQ